MIERIARVDTSEPPCSLFVETILSWPVCICSTIVMLEGNYLKQKRGARSKEGGGRSYEGGEKLGEV